MLEQESRQRKEIRSEYNVAKASGLIGAVLAAGGAVADYNFISTPNTDKDLILWATGAALFGASLIVNGGLRYNYTKDIEKRLNEDIDNAF